MDDVSKDVEQSSRWSGPEQKYVWITVIVLVLLGFPFSRFQPIIKMAVWTAIFLGVYLPFVWPCAKDALSRAVVISIVLAHFVVVCSLFPHIPHDDYMFIGIIIVGELLVFSIPAGWLIVRERKRDKGI